jgi:hypothetical protein
MNFELTTLSLQDLERRIANAERERGELEREIQRRENMARLERHTELRALLKPEIINALVPEHERTSCSDADLRNGFNGEIVRCARCALLEALNGGCFDVDYDVTVIFNIQKARVK